MNILDRMINNSQRELLVKTWYELDNIHHPNCVYAGTPPEEMPIEQLLAEVNEMLGERRIN